MEKKVKIKEEEIYVSKDGKEFCKIEECKSHEDYLNLVGSIKKKPIEVFVYESTDGEQFTSESDCFAHQKHINNVSELNLKKITCKKCNGRGEKEQYSKVYEGFGSDGAGNWGSHCPPKPEVYNKFIGIVKCETCLGKGHVYEFIYGSRGDRIFGNKQFNYNEVDNLKYSFDNGLK